MCWLIRELCPEATVLHVESHTNGNGREKGCAWVYVNDHVSEEALLSLHKRVFMDINDAGEEGAWVATSSPDAIEELAALSTQHAYVAFRPTQLPRQPLVVERPQGKNVSPQQYQRKFPPKHPAPTAALLER